MRDTRKSKRRTKNYKEITTSNQKKLKFLLNMMRKERLEILALTGKHRVTYLMNLFIWMTEQGL